MATKSQAVQQKDISKAAALKFIILIGLTSLFADMTYEAARSITGPFLATLGASAAIVGFVAGFGEFLGYSLRLVSRGSHGRGSRGLGCRSGRRQSVVDALPKD